MDAQQLYIDSVQHRYGSKTVLTGVYLSCKIGECVGLLGRNGSGKSTLLQIIFGSITPHYKHQLLNSKLIEKAYLTKEVAYLPQDNFIPGKLKVLAAIHLFCNKYKNELLAVPAIAPYLTIPFEKLSGGNRRLAECLIIMYNDAPFVLLDEPFSQLGPLLIDEIIAHMKQLLHLKGFIVTDHYYRDILRCATRMVLLQNGCNHTVDGIEGLQQYGYLPEAKPELKTISA